MLHGLEGAGRFDTDSLSRRVRCNELGMFRFQLLQFPDQAIVLGIRDFDIVEDVLPVIVVPDFVAKRLDFLFEVRH